ncbi:hypothetical protein ACXYRO_01595 [Mycoplasma sp. 4013]
MLFKNKLFKFIFGTTPIITIIASACSTSKHDNKNSETQQTERNLGYSINLLRLKQQSQDIKLNNSQIFDQFIPYKKDQWSAVNYFNQPLLIKTKDEFIKNVVGKVNELYQKYNLNKSMSDEEITKTFEDDFLDAKNIDDILKTQNILIYEQTPYQIPSYLDYLVYDAENDMGKIKIFKILPGYYLDVKHLYIYYTRKIFTIFKLPKNKDYEIKEFPNDQIDQYINNLSNELHYKKDDFILGDKQIDIKLLINKAQIRQDIIYKPVEFLGELTNDILALIPSTTEYLKITNESEFNNQFLDNIYNISQNLHLNLSKQEIKNIFQSQYLKAKDLSDILTNNNLYIRIIKEKGNIYHFTYPYQTIKYYINSRNKEMTLAKISERVFEFNSRRSDDQNKEASDVKVNLILEVFQAPNDYSIKFKGVLNFKETNDFLVKQR